MYDAIKQYDNVGRNHFLASKDMERINAYLWSFLWGAIIMYWAGIKPPELTCQSQTKYSKQQIHH